MTPATSSLSHDCDDANHRQIARLHSGGSQFDSPYHFDDSLATTAEVVMAGSVTPFFDGGDQKNIINIEQVSMPKPDEDELEEEGDTGQGQGGFG
jgi:hypothetical protein